MVLTDDLVSYYKLDNDSTDAHGSNDGADTSITYSTADGKINEGGNFDGASSYITLPDLSGSLSTSFSWSGWVKRADQSVSSYVWAMNNSDSPEIYLRVTYSSPNMSYNVSIYDSGASQANLTHSMTYDNDWHYIVITATTDEFKLYVDGVEEDSDVSGSFNVDGSSHHQVGYYSASGSAKFEGSIDEVGIWSRVLTSDEVTKLWNNGLGYAFVDIRNRGTVKGSTGTIGSKGISKRYPVVEGLTAGSTKQTGVPYLEEQGLS